VIVLDEEPEASLGGQAFWSFGGSFLVDSTARTHEDAETQPPSHAQTLAQREPAAGACYDGRRPGCGLRLWRGAAVHQVGDGHDTGTYGAGRPDHRCSVGSHGHEHGSRSIKLASLIVGQH
jgi:hypothetical protein